MSWKPEVVVDSSDKWYGNALRFATRAEAHANAHDLTQRWLAVRDYRATRSRDPVNYRYLDGELIPIDSAEDPLR